MLKGISIIVCCYNSEKRLPETLQHIASQKGCETLNIQVIVVDNASTDQTRNVATTLCNSYNLPNYIFTITEELEPGLSSARERGITEAIYNYLIFCDDDNWLEENYVATSYQLFEQSPNVAALGGIGTAVFSSPTSKPNWFDTYYHAYAVGSNYTEEREVEDIYGAGMCLKKDAYLKTFKVFGPLLLSGRKGKKLTAGEDSEICIRLRILGYSILYSPNLKFKHFLPDNRLTWSYLLKLHQGFAKSFVILDLYKKVINKAKVGRMFWLQRSVHYSLLVTKYFFKYSPKLVSKTKYKREPIILSNWLIFSSDYLKYNNKVYQIFNNINNAIKSINT